MANRNGADDVGTRTDAVETIIEDWRRERPDLDPAPLQVLGRLHRTFLRYQSVVARTVQSHGLNLAGFDVLTALRRAGTPYRRTAGELAASGLITSAGITMRIDRLEKDGLIVRERDPGDRRVVYSRLTDEGLRRIDVLFAEHLENERRMLAGLTAEECAQLGVLLGKLERSLDAAQDE